MLALDWYWRIVVLLSLIFVCILTYYLTLWSFCFIGVKCLSVLTRIISYFGTNVKVFIFVCYIADDKMPVITRLTLLMLCLIVYVMIKFRAMEDGMLYRYVSWNEFTHNMLAKGEVGSICSLCSNSTSICSCCYC